MAVFAEPDCKARMAPHIALPLPEWLSSAAFDAAVAVMLVQTPEWHLCCCHRRFAASRYSSVAPVVRILQSAAGNLLQLLRQRDRRSSVLPSRRADLKETAGIGWGAEHIWEARSLQQPPPHHARAFQHREWPQLLSFDVHSHRLASSYPCTVRPKIRRLQLARSSASWAPSEASSEKMSWAQKHTSGVRSCAMVSPALCQDQHCHCPLRSLPLRKG